MTTIFAVTFVRLDKFSFLTRKVECFSVSKQMVTTSEDEAISRPQVFLFNDVVNSGQMEYLLTYKLSQDHLELLFGAVRASLGYNNNPSVVQFEAAIKRIIVCQDLAG